MKNGYGGKTWAEFSINPKTWPGHDSYDLSVIPGYDIAMQILAPFGGYFFSRSLVLVLLLSLKCPASHPASRHVRFSPICTYAGCPDAFHYWNDYSKVHVVNSGGTFTVVFCA